MSRLLEALPSLAVAAACYALERKEHGRVEEIRVLSEALGRERQRNSDLDRELLEVRNQRNEYIRAFDDQVHEYRVLRDEVRVLREEFEMAKKPPMPMPPKGKPPGKPGKKKPKPC